MLSPETSAFRTGLAILLLVTSQLSGCSQRTSVYEYTLDTPGTSTLISIAGLEQEQADQAAASAMQALASLGQTGFTPQAGSELQRINEALAKGRTIAVSKELLDVLTKVRDLSQASGGLFNPAAGALTALREYHCDREECTDAPYPDRVQNLVEKELARILRKPPSMTDLVIRGNRVSSRNRQVRLEFTDIIRGLALDVGIRSLQQAGAVNAMIDIDGSVHTSGTRGEHAWRAGIPDATGKHLVGTIETAAGESIITVRALDTTAGKQGLTYRRVVDPRNGMPVQDTGSVTVIHDSALAASAAATAFLVSGTEHWKTIADHMGVRAVVMITANGTIYTSPAIERRINWKQGVMHRHLVP